MDKSNLPQSPEPSHHWLDQPRNVNRIVKGLYLLFGLVLAVDLLETHPDMASRLHERWPVVLEDEAQDSVPLQEELLARLTADRGHWIRVATRTSRSPAPSPPRTRAFYAASSPGAM